MTGDFRLVASTALVVAFACACGDPAPLRIGIVIGGDGILGARLAAAEVNASHGIRGRPLMLRVMNEGGWEARRAIAAAESLSTDPTILGVVGHSNSSASLAASQIYNARKVVQVAPTSSAASLSDAGPYTFRVVPSDISQAQFLADEVLREGALPGPAVVYVNDDYGRSLHQAIRSRLGAAGFVLAFELPYAENVPLPDVEGVARAVAGSGAKALVWLGRSQQLQQLLPALRRTAPGIRVLASDALDTRATFENPGVLIGIHFVCFVDAQGSRPQLASLRERFKAKTALAITAEMALTYDAVMLIATAAREAGANRGAVRDYLESLGSTRPAFQGATGEIAFDKNGDPHSSYCLGEVTDKGVRILRAKDER